MPSAVHEQVRQEVFCTGAAGARRIYVEMVVPLGEATRESNRVMIDDEHREYTYT